MKTEQEVVQRIKQVQDEIRDLQMSGEVASIQWVVLHVLEWVIDKSPTTDIWSNNK